MYFLFMCAGAVLLGRRGNHEIQFKFDVADEPAGLLIYIR